jgi:DNA-binding transcriptional regulator YdaS (Cro superfamily)
MEDAGIEALRRGMAELKWTQEKVASVVGVKQPSVSHILNGGKRVPAEWCLPIQRESNGVISAAELRSDIFHPDNDAGGSQTSAAS